jgi:hypothetical protein
LAQTFVSWLATARWMEGGATAAAAVQVDLM